MQKATYPAYINNNITHTTLSDCRDDGPPLLAARGAACFLPA